MKTGLEMTRSTPFLRFADKSVSFWFLVFALLIALTQLGSLTQEVINWDESTFIIIASKVLDGILPNTDFFDMKPPMMYFGIASSMKIFGENLASVRIFGDFCILITAFFTFSISRKFVSTIQAGLATSAMIAVHAIRSAQHTQTEHLAIAFVMIATWCLVEHRRHLWSAFIVGACVSLATLTRTNLGLVVIAVGFYYVICLVRRQEDTHAQALWAYIVGGLTPLAGVVLAYWANGAVAQFFLASFLAPLQYSQQSPSLIGIITTHFMAWARATRTYPLVLGPFTILVLIGVGRLIGLCLKAVQDRHLPEARTAHDFAIVLLVFAAIAISIVFGGVFARHYWGQVFPFFAIFVALGISLDAGWGKTRPILYCIAAIPIAGSLFLTAPNAIRVVLDWETVERSHYVKNAAKLISADRKPGDTVWAPEFHLALWYLDEPLLSRAVHPSQLIRRGVSDLLVGHDYIARNEYERIMALRPTYIVRRDDRPPWYFREVILEDFETMLTHEYEKWKISGPVAIFRRLDLGRLQKSQRRSRLPFLIVDGGSRSAT